MRLRAMTGQRRVFFVLALLRAWPRCDTLLFQYEAGLHAMSVAFCYSVAFCCSRIIHYQSGGRYGGSGLTTKCSGVPVSDHKMWDSVYCDTIGMDRAILARQDRTHNNSTGLRTMATTVKTLVKLANELHGAYAALNVFDDESRRLEMVRPVSHPVRERRHRRDVLLQTVDRATDRLASAMDKTTPARLRMAERAMGDKVYVFDGF